MFRFTAPFEVVSLFLLITELLLLPSQLLAFTRHALCLFAPFLNEVKKKMCIYIYINVTMTEKPSFSNE